MKRVKTVSGMQKISESLRIAGEKIGFVPTMGYLHDGHLNLVRISKKKSAVTVVSIFVNPTQFAPNEDFGRYPRDMKRDLRLLRELGVDYVFTPDAAAMYPEPYLTYVAVEEMSSTGEGQFRPTHFRGVTTIVTKLLNCVNPHVMYMGQKDIQQAVILKKMVRDLNMQSRIAICPTVRETDGLAMSSRNIYLRGEERGAALALITALRSAQHEVKSGTTETAAVIDKMEAVYRQFTGAKPEYCICVDHETFRPLERIVPRTVIATAARVGKTRLIDNIIVSPPVKKKNL